MCQLNISCFLAWRKLEQLVTWQLSAPGERRLIILLAKSSRVWPWTYQHSQLGGQVEPGELPKPEKTRPSFMMDGADFRMFSTQQPHCKGRGRLKRRPLRRRGNFWEAAEPRGPRSGFLIQVRLKMRAFGQFGIVWDSSENLWTVFDSLGLIETVEQSLGQFDKVWDSFSQLCTV